MSSMAKPIKFCNIFSVYVISFAVAGSAHILKVVCNETVIDLYDIAMNNKSLQTQVNIWVITLDT